MYGSLLLYTHFHNIYVEYLFIHYTYLRILLPHYLFYLGFAFGYILIFIYYRSTPPPDDASSLNERYRYHHLNIHNL